MLECGEGQTDRHRDTDTDDRTRNVTRHRERVQGCTRWHFAFALRCHSNATGAPIAKSAR